MWQLMHGHGRSRRPIVAEALAIHFVVTREIIHVYKVCGHFHDVFEACTDIVQNLAHVLENSLGLDPNIEMRSAQLIDLCSGNRVVSAPGARPRHKDKVAGTLDVRIFSARLRPTCNHFAFDLPHLASPPVFTEALTAGYKYYSVLNKNSANAVRLRGRSRKAPRRQTAYAGPAGTSNSPT